MWHAEASKKTLVKTKDVKLTQLLGMWFDTEDRHWPILTSEIITCSAWVVGDLSDIYVWRMTPTTIDLVNILASYS